MSSTSKVVGRATDLREPIFARVEADPRRTQARNTDDVTPSRSRIVDAAR
jgi:hypothetical protein